MWRIPLHQEIIFYALFVFYIDIQVKERYYNDKKWVLY